MLLIFGDFAVALILFLCLKRSLTSDLGSETARINIGIIDSRGFLPSYTKWTFHGESSFSRKTHYPINDDEGSNMRDDIDGLLHDTFRNIDAESRHGEGVGERLPEDATKYFKLLEEGENNNYIWGVRILVEIEREDGTQSTDAFTTVMGPDHPGRRLNPELTLDPNMLGFNVHSSGESLTNQPIYRPSVGSNNQAPVPAILQLDSIPSLPCIISNSHLDSVPVELDKWTYLSFSTHMTSNGKIFARAQDDKCIGMHYLEAIKVIQNFDPNFVPLRNIHIVYVPDEEVGGFDGMKKFVELKECEELNVGFMMDGQASTNDEFKSVLC
ncbi:hypothetical protein CQW23_02674 [Capsicum baccatum]|uniref:Uncharacterized protein n=1 Tax=Capsicum baccatum TaxID=33114 RepID=A0A2G2XSH0_CAPBA|nr:hypothetical protein CQW23_02674 [Capsicum baccatum]